MKRSDKVKKKKPQAISRTHRITHYRHNKSDVKIKKGLQEELLDLMVVGKYPLAMKIFVLVMSIFLVCMVIFGCLVSGDPTVLLLEILFLPLLYYVIWSYRTFERADKIADERKRLKAKERILDVTEKISKCLGIFAAGLGGFFVSLFIIVIAALPNLFFPLWVLGAILLWFKIFR